MDDDGDEDSQSELTGSLSWWMMKSLWKEDSKLRLLVADTILLQDGHLLHWLFTSSKSGRVLKRAIKRLDWDALTTFLVRSARSRSRGQRSNDSLERSAEIIATARKLREGKPYVIMLTALDLKSLREKHNAHLLDQIVAIQPFVARNPFTGCGLFETEFVRKGRSRTAQAALATYELLRWPEEDVKWFDDFERPRDCDTILDARSEVGSTGLGRRNGSATRVHGVLHRMLATTTRQIVEYIERETQEVILRVIAQFTFTPGSGQPTLLWLDSIHTTRSTQQINDNTPVRNIDPDSEFMQLTHELGERSRSWTTFFPPKIGNLAGGNGLSGLAGVNLSAGSRRSDFVRKKTKGSFQREMNAKTHTPQAGMCDPFDASDLALRDQCDAENKAIPDIPDAATDKEFGGAGAMGDQGVGSTPAVKEEGILAMYNDKRLNSYFPARGGQWGHFTLPTESWVRRSSESRGHYRTLTVDEGGRAERSLNERWPRKRSTGTTMRGNGSLQRSDLRGASENRRPCTSPAGQTRGLEGCTQGAGRVGSDGEAVSFRPSSGFPGCFGDYCHFEGRFQGSSAGGGDDPNDEKCKRTGPRSGTEGTGATACKKVPYRSLLKSRAEEKVLSTIRTKVCETNGVRGGVSERFPNLQGLGDMDRHHQKGKCKPILASLIAERMRFLATSLSDEGCGQYFSLHSSDRAKAGTPESAQRAVEELLYEEVLSHLYPTTVSRLVTVCDTCAMVYGYMDTCRKQAKSIKTASGEMTQLARIEVSRRLHQRSRQPTAVMRQGQEFTSPLRRYSDLHLGSMPETAPGRVTRGARPATADGHLPWTHKEGKGPRFLEHT